ncbi:unnamed protein product [Didymodactylos carnosus]|uniref:C3H1-type domain-containing protein n=1 Tax=Didymodactylos carnosus TaxID=1234261 RepID=A0A813YZU5_9BILA|nr:unnamed protein product [Didymodactylos carnosus]CAF0891342.1 unnamed protein product [Didymodactylos carnosus]CAF3577731.1 unnamed protein product [Didymodactylos carnosus]CAF3675577.1 unnamed protein product [Didymodactylos carnosus]
MAGDPHQAYQLIMSSSLNNTTGNNEKPTHLNYLSSFRVDQCQLFLQHKCTQHRPFTCFHWHFMNQRRRRPLRRKDGTFCYDPDFYCDKYDEQSGVCSSGEDCQFLHRNAGDTEKRYHLRYLKTAICTHETDAKGHCVKNGPHCSYAHGLSDSRQPVFDIREIQNSELALERLSRLSVSLENERALNDDPKWNDSQYVLANYKTESCKRPPRLCRQGYACPQYHNPRDRRRNPSIFKYKSTPCPHVKQSDEWMDSTACESGDNCKYCHTRTEQQFHPEIYKSTKCNDVSVTGYCPRGPFCAFAHIEQELKAYRDFDHFTNELPLSSFIPIPEEKEVSITMNASTRPQKKLSQASLFEVGSYPSTNAKTFDQMASRNLLFTNDSSFGGSGTFAQEQEQQHMTIENTNRSPPTPLFSEFRSISSPMSIHPDHALPPPPSLSNETSTNLQFSNTSLAAAVAALQAATTSHYSQSYPPLSLLSFPQTTHQQQQNSAATNFITSIHAHLSSVETPSSLSPFISSGRSLPNTSYFDDEGDDLDHTDTSPLRFVNYQSDAPTTVDVKNLIGLSLKTIGIENIDVDEVDFDKASNNNDVLLEGMDNFDTHVHSSTAATSPIPTISSTTKTSLISNRTTLPVNIPNSFQASYADFSQSPSRSPFDLLSSTKQQQHQDETLDSPINSIFPEPSTTGSGGHPGSYAMSGFSHDIPSIVHQSKQGSASPQSNYSRLNSSNGAISSASSSSIPNEIDIMRNRVLQMQVMAITQKEASDHWRREAEDNHRMAMQLEQEKNRAIQQRDDALHQIDTMRHLLTQNMRLLPSDNDLMSLPLDDVRLLQSRLKQELMKIALVERAKSNNIHESANMHSPTPQTHAVSSNQGNNNGKNPVLLHSAKQ